MTPAERRAASRRVSMAIVGLVILFAIAHFVPIAPGPDYFVFRCLVALCMAFAAAELPGTLGIELPGGIKAGGALAVLVFVFKVDPAGYVIPRPPRDHLKIAPVSATIHQGDTLQLRAVLETRDSAPIAVEARWVSDYPLIADVSSTGLVTGKGPGTATIGASTSGLSAAATVIVVPNPATNARFRMWADGKILETDSTTTRWAKLNTLDLREAVGAKTSGALLLEFSSPEPDSVVFFADTGRRIRGTSLSHGNTRPRVLIERNPPGPHATDYVLFANPGADMNNLVAAGIPKGNVTYSLRLYDGLNGCTRWIIGVGEFNGAFNTLHHTLSDSPDLTACR